VNPVVEEKETRIEKLEQAVLNKARIDARERIVKINSFELNIDLLLV
jgi:hypothetical protein